MTKDDNKLLVDATQTAFLWRYRRQYGSRAQAIRALTKRRSAEYKISSECETAFEIGLAVVKATEYEISLFCDEPQSKTELMERAEAIYRAVKKSFPEAPEEMINYALGMLLWMPLMI